MFWCIKKSVSIIELAYKGNTEKKEGCQKVLRISSQQQQIIQPDMGPFSVQGPVWLHMSDTREAGSAFPLKSYDLVGERNKNRSNYMQIIFDKYNEIQTLEKVALLKT